MSEREFKAAIVHLLILYRKRMRRLQAIASGEVKAKRVKVKGHWVKKHWIGEHTRYL
jgi:hypothetical protein